MTVEHQQITHLTNVYFEATGKKFQEKDKSHVRHVLLSYSLKDDDACAIKQLSLTFFGLSLPRALLLSSPSKHLPTPV